jgi:tetratricopeptide (TPR) repeat protein
MMSKCRKYLYITASIIILFILYNKFSVHTKIDEWKLFHHQVHTALHNEEYEKVIEACDDIIHKNPHSLELYPIYVKKSQALSKLHLYKESLEVANIAITINNQKEDGFLAKVDPLFQLNRDEELTAVLEEVIILNPNTHYKALLNCMRRDRCKVAY